MSDVNCYRYPVRKLIYNGDKIEEIFLWKAPTNGVPPIPFPPKSGCEFCNPQTKSEV